LLGARPALGEVDRPDEPAATSMAVPEMLRLLPPTDENAEPKVYGSPAKSTGKRECLRVQKCPSIERLILMDKEQEEAEAAARDIADAEDRDEGAGSATVHSRKKSQYWSKEVEEKLGLGGVDPYGLLELDEKRYRASADEIRKAYRRLVLTMHPDKKASVEASSPKKADKKAKDEDSDATAGGEEGGEEEDDEEEEFKLLSAAWELLSNTETRRQYDSIDNFNDFLPTGFRYKKDDEDHFYDTFRPPFMRQAKFSNTTPVPQLGDATTPMEQVNKFYKFWFSLSSWRDFGLLCEHDLKEAEDREERRWMQRQNKNYAASIKKDEVRRVQAFVQLAYDHDPRVKADKEERIAAKARAKEDKERAQREARQAEEKAKQEIENAAAAAKAAEVAAQQVSADEKANAKKEKERLRSALKKARKELKALGEAGGAWDARAADLDVIAAVLPTEELVALTATLSAGANDETTAALEAAKAKAMA